VKKNERKLADAVRNKRKWKYTKWPIESTKGRK
jgi:hypothetical protein